MTDTSPPPPEAYGEAWADLYDHHRAMVPPPAQIDLLAELAGDGRALELAIGTGRVALPLAERGVRVEGVDASPSMVARLREKPGGNAIPVVIGDMTDPPVEGPFDLVYLVFSTFFALPDQESQVACFEAVARLLAPGGAFCLRCFMPDLGRFDRDQTVRLSDIDGASVALDASRHDVARQVIEARTIILTDGQPPSIRPVRIRYAWPPELDLMARLAGLRLDRRLGDWDGAPFSAASGFHVSIYRPDGDV